MIGLNDCRYGPECDVTRDTDNGRSDEYSWWLPVIEVRDRRLSCDLEVKPDPGRKLRVH